MVVATHSSTGVAVDVL